MTDNAKTVFFPKGVSEGSFLNLGHQYLAFKSWPLDLGHHYLAFNYLAFVCSPFHFLLFSSISLLSPFWILVLFGYRPRGFVAKVTMINMVWRTPVLQMTVFIMPVRRLIQTEQFLIWFGDHMFSK